MCQSAEEFSYPSRYSLIVAGGSLHWMDWYSVMPLMTSSLTGRGYLAIVGGRRTDEPWASQLRELVPRYSTNQDFASYDLIEELG